MSYFRPAVDAMSGYVPGEQPQAGKFIKLNTNENPYPASAAVARAVQAVLERGLERYPDPMATGFRRRAGEVLGVDPDWILCGNGSDEILTLITRAFVAACVLHGAQSRKSGEAYIHHPVGTALNAADLKLDAAQQAKVRTILVARSEQMQALQHDTRLTPAERRQRVLAIGDSSAEQIRAQLTDAQRAQYIQPRAATAVAQAGPAGRRGALAVSPATAPGKGAAQ